MKLVCLATIGHWIVLLETNFLVCPATVIPTALGTKVTVSKPLGPGVRSSASVSARLMWLVSPATSAGQDFPT